MRFISFSANSEIDTIVRSQDSVKWPALQHFPGIKVKAWKDTRLY